MMGGGSLKRGPSLFKRDLDSLFFFCRTRVDQFWTTFGPEWTSFGPLLDQSGPVLDQFLVQWTTFGPLLDHFWTTFGPEWTSFWTRVDQSGPVFGPRWSRVDQFLVQSGPLLDQSGPVFGPVDHFFGPVDHFWTSKVHRLSLGIATKNRRWTTWTTFFLLN